MIIPNFSDIRLEESAQEDSRQTGKAGLVFVNQAVRDFGVPAIIDQYFHLPLSNAGYRASEKILPAVLSFIGGGRTIEDLEIIRQDHGLLSACSMQRMCSADCFREMLFDDRTQECLESAMAELAVKAMREDKKHESYTLDTDWTLIPSDKESAAWSYKKIKGYGSLLSFIKELPLAVAQDFKTGNESPASGINEQIIVAHKLATEAGKRIQSFRSDAAAHNANVFNTCDELGINFYISLDKNSVVKQDIQDVYDKKSQWHEVPGDAGREFTEALYSMPGYDKNYALRILILRWKPKQPELFDIEGYRHHVICTNNNDIDALDWLTFHNGRMGSENYNKELKAGLALSHCPSQNLMANRNYYFIGILAFNMFSIFKYFYAPREMRSWSLKTFRWRFVSVCGRWLTHARQIIYRLYNLPEEIFEYFQYIQFKFSSA